MGKAKFNVFEPKVIIRKNFEYYRLDSKAF